MARFPIYTDADVRGSLVKGLVARRWDVVRAIDIYPKRTPDNLHFEKAAELGRVLVTNDQPAIDIANEWLRQGRPFSGVITWLQEHYLRMSDGDFLEKFEELAAKDQPLNPFYPIVYLHSD